MRKSRTTDKILAIEAALEALKRFVIRAPDAPIDAKNWAQVKDAGKRSRKATFRKAYGKTEGLP